MAKPKAKKNAPDADFASGEWTPLTPEEVQAERARRLVDQLEATEHELAQTKEQRASLDAHIRELKKEIKVAKRLSVPQRARINTLDRKWRRQWVKYYDEFLARPRGYGPSDAAALAWSRIKVHCTKDHEGHWVCPPWEQVFGAVAKGRLPKGISKSTAGKVRSKLKPRKKRAKKGP